jgi:cytochrome c55X
MPERSLALALALAALPALAAEPPAARQAELLYRLDQDCGSCHGLTRKGGLGPPLLPADLVEKDRESLVAIVLHGVPGTPMPPWQGELSTDEAGWLVDRLIEGR